MAFAVANDFTGAASLSAADLDENFDNIEDLLNGGLTAENLSASSDVLNSQLQNSLYEIILSHTIQGSATADEGLDLLATAFHVLGSVPYDIGDGTGVAYTILAIETCTILQSTPSIGAVFKLVHGSASDIAADLATSIKADIAVGTATNDAQVTDFTAGITTNSSQPKFFALDVTTAGAGYTAGDSFNITIKLKRDNGLRG